MRGVLCIVIALAQIVTLFAANADLSRVNGRGVGVDRLEALKDAYRDAVERAVGMYVDAEQLVKNGKLVNDQILTQSNAYIEKYEVAREAKTASGLVIVTILADVRKRDLQKKIRDVMPSQTIDLSGVSKALHAQIVTDFKANDDALSIVRNELNGLEPLKQLMKLTLATARPVVEQVEEDASIVRLWYPVKVEVDADKYYNEFAPRWSRVLDQVKVAPAKRWELKGNAAFAKAYDDAVAERFGSERKKLAGVMTKCDEARIRREPVLDILAYWGAALNEEYEGMGFFDTRILGKDYLLHGFGSNNLWTRVDCQSNWAYRDRGRVVGRVFMQGLQNCNQQQKVDGECKFCVGIVTASHGQSLSGKIYQIPQNCIDEVVEWQNRMCGDWDSATEVDFALRFIGSDGGIVVEQTFSLCNLDLMNFACALLEDTKWSRNCSAWTGGTRLWMITPLVGGFAKSYVKWVSVDIPKDDVMRIVSAKISVQQ